MSYNDRCIPTSYSQYRQHVIKESIKYPPSRPHVHASPQPLEESSYFDQNNLRQINSNNIYSIGSSLMLNDRDSFQVNHNQYDSSQVNHDPSANMKLVNEISFMPSETNSYNLNYLSHQSQEENSIKYEEVYAPTMKPDNKSNSRVNHITEINNKIQKILECLTNEEQNIVMNYQKSTLKYHSRNSDSEEAENKTNLFYQNTRQTNQQPKLDKKSFQNERANITKQKENQKIFLQKIENKYQGSFRTPLRIKNNNRFQPSNTEIQKLYSYTNFSNFSSVKKENKLSLEKEFEISREKQKNRKDIWKYSPTYSLNSDQKFRGSENKRVQKKYDSKLIVKGIVVNDEISKIQKKIQQLEKMKKQLKIQFTPISFDKSSVINRSNFEQKIKNDQSKIQAILLPEDVSIPKILKNHHNKKKTKGKEIQNSKNITHQNNKSQLNDLQSQKTQASMPRSQTQNEQFQEKNIQFQYSFVNSNKNDQKGEKQKFQKGRNDEILRFYEMIQIQIKYDQRLRIIKKWFQRSRNGSKWDELKELLIKQYLFLDEGSMQAIFTSSEQQQNPFYTARDTDYTISNLVNAFVQSEQHWLQHIKNQYHPSLLKDGGFNEQSIDISHKGFIVIEDIVRFFNYQLDAYFRNRDLYLIVKRISSNSSIKFLQMAHAFFRKL